MEETEERTGEARGRIRELTDEREVYALVRGHLVPLKEGEAPGFPENTVSSQWAAHSRRLREERGRPSTDMHIKENTW